MDDITHIINIISNKTNKDIKTRSVTVLESEDLACRRWRDCHSAANLTRRGALAAAPFVDMPNSCRARASIRANRSLRSSL
ncbi:hypothetical protein [Prevotella sp. S7-1-8]|uniref:hypothetical protein n=1 Tax=Prevotella sp. S7-1-8 TaxID=1284775 RepID=UPI00055D3E00|nr:hypothetical protein [Prevotella sp. S7-1-8]